MIINLTAWVNSQYVRVKAAPMDMLINIPNLMAYRAATKKIVSLGKTAEEMKAQSPLSWRLYEKQIAFKKPFDVSAFDPDTSASVLMFYAYRASHLAHPGTFGQLIGYFSDRFAYDLQLAGYESAPQDLRDRFEGLMRRERSLTRFTVNGRIVKGA